MLEALSVCLFFQQKQKNHTRTQTKDNPTVFVVVPAEVRSSVERYDPSTGHWEAKMGKDGIFFWGGGEGGLHPGRLTWNLKMMVWFR